MITRIYVDNYKCFTNFDFSPQAVQPIFGGNGSGKTTLFEVLNSIRDFVIEGERCATVFPSTTLTRWDPRKRQTISIEFLGTKGRYSYKLIVVHGTTQSSRIEREELYWENTSLYQFADGQARMTDAVGSEKTVRVESTRSCLYILIEGLHADLVPSFSNSLSRFVMSRLIPSQMTSQTSAEEDRLSNGGGNFASWYRRLVQEDFNAVSSITNDLKQVIDGFDSLTFVTAGDVKVLKVLMARPEGQDGKPIVFDFRELSDGQRVLIVLYSLLHGSAGAESVLCLDEPANFLALPEIQPLLVRLRDSVGDGWSQLFVVSHHPESIDYLAADGAVRFVRDGIGPVRVEPFPKMNPDGLKASELVARGWDG
ncbi:AAA family ATPase [Fimbriiglobus ruber]|uniref:AAA family ATPase n=1 Tax=Fimbriiglobus ruber TaxID=1908690 RepID=UPI000B4BC792|nr:ATP-binding protein [Fimbriiglobus ruber]